MRITILATLALIVGCGGVIESPVRGFEAITNQGDDWLCEPSESTPWGNTGVQCWDGGKLTEVYPGVACMTCTSGSGQPLAGCALDPDAWCVATCGECPAVAAAIADAMK